MRNVTLYTHEYGPFPHIIRIALAEKGAQPGLDFELEPVDPTAKSTTFAEISPTGQTPLLLVDGEPIFETAAVLECVDELFDPGHSLRAETPVARARDRSWTLFGLDLLMDSFQALMAQEEESHLTHAAKLKNKLHHLEARRELGPYFGGSRLGLVDLVYAAFFLRQNLFHQAFGWDALGPFPNLRGWATELLSRPSVRATLPDDFETVVVGFIRAQGGYVTRPASA